MSIRSAQSSMHCSPAGLLMLRPTANRSKKRSARSSLLALGRLNPALPRDLNSVVRKALRKEPSERYPTVDAFADDLRAILESRPVKVRSGDAWYKARKFVRRHWLPVSAVAAAILSLAAGLYLACRERNIAQQRFAQLRQLSNRVIAFDGDIRGLPGSTKAREKIVSVSMEGSTDWGARPAMIWI